MSDFVDPVVIAQITAAKNELVTEVAKAKTCITEICDYAGSLPNPIIPEAPIDGNTYGRKDAAWVQVGGGSLATWGHISGTLTDQLDLKAALDLKANSADISTVGKSNLYSDLDGKPTILPEAPNDGQQYARQNNSWQPVKGGGGIPTDPTITGKITQTTGDVGEEVEYFIKKEDLFIQYPALLGDNNWSLKMSPQGIFFAGSNGTFNRLAQGVDYTTLEKVKLQGIETAAQVNKFDFTDAPKDGKQYSRKNGTWSEVASSGGTNITIDTQPADVDVNSSTGSNGKIPAATTTKAGVMTAADKTKLQGIETGSQKNKFDFADAPKDTKLYGRKGGTWEEVDVSSSSTVIDAGVVGMGDDPSLDTWGKPNAKTTAVRGYVNEAFKNPPAGVTDYVGVINKTFLYDNTNGARITYITADGRHFERIKLSGGYENWVEIGGKATSTTAAPTVGVDYTANIITYKTDISNRAIGTFTPRAEELNQWRNKQVWFNPVTRSKYGTTYGLDIKSDFIQSWNVGDEMVIHMLIGDTWNGSAPKGKLTCNQFSVVKPAKGYSPLFKGFVQINYEKSMKASMNRLSATTISFTLRVVKASSAKSLILVNTQIN